ncbi:hypothetical protein O3G_MSEX004524 [Manduca sexta]|uniref:Uncharacterized protein n=1 Tax=Manduca sexta TaxID=7130 RepID=A0A921YVZ0_MANSE|nr:hypothetical protein O3G_MSEX004524 [Manduca sexta]
MNDIHRDFLVTYDPAYFEEHSESSEFEESIPSITPKDSNQFLLTKENKKVTKKHKDNLNRKIYTNHESLKKHKYNNFHNLEEKIVQTSTLNNRNVNGKVAESGERKSDIQNNQNKQRKSIIRHKIIPCLSSMFGRSVSKLSPKENQIKKEYKDYSCQVQCSNTRRRRKKESRPQNYTVQPVYEIKGVMHGKQFATNAPKVPQDNSKSLKRVYSNIICNVTVSDDETEKLEKLKKRKYRKRLQSELREANLKLKYNKKRKHHCQQFPSKQSLYHVYTTSNQGQYKVAKGPPQDFNNSMTSELSLTSSGFWDYLLEKFNKKGNSRKLNEFRQSQRKDFAIQCCPVNFDTSAYGPYTETRYARKNYNLDDDCPCSETNISYPRNPCRDFANNFNTDKRQKTEATQCECYPPKRPKPTIQKQCVPLQESVCGCQQPHDDMADAVANKYNGEILCIHNPPCILINGCLNLTQPADAAPVNAWPVVETKKDSLFRGYMKAKKPKQKQEQYSQYHAQCIEVRQCTDTALGTAPEQKKEKIIQSICNHNPPCEVVRCCYKPKYDPKLQNSCVHVPMCQKVPECLMQKGRDNKTTGTCEHKPKCPEVPLCTRKYVELTARDSIGTQVKPQMKIFCRHDPPCILIPKCLGGAVRETYISYEAIPNCVHQPLCDLIPACCRKSTKGMVSTCSQYPNGCRVV